MAYFDRNSPLRDLVNVFSQRERMAMQSIGLTVANDADEFTVAELLIAFRAATPRLTADELGHCIETLFAPQS